MVEQNNKNGIAFINSYLRQMRSWLSNFRAATNNLIDLYQKRLDEAELRTTEEGIALPVSKIEESEVIDSDVIHSGGSEKRV